MNNNKRPSSPATSPSIHNNCSNCRKNLSSLQSLQNNIILLQSKFNLVVQEVKKCKKEIQEKDSIITQMIQEKERKRNEPSSVDEDRVHDLEESVSLLSTMIGEYKRQRSHDLETINELRDKIDKMSNQINEEEEETLFSRQTIKLFRSRTTQTSDEDKKVLTKDSSSQTTNEEQQPLHKTKETVVVNPFTSSVSKRHQVILHSSQSADQRIKSSDESSRVTRDTHDMNRETRDNVNLIYVKNVIQKLLSTRDSRQQKIIMNALHTALQTI